MNESLIAEARELVEAIAAQSARERELFETAYRLGFTSGEEVGYKRAHLEMAASWSRLRQHVRGMAKVMSPAERLEPGGEIYEARLRRHGGQEYQGAAAAQERRVA